MKIKSPIFRYTPNPPFMLGSAFEAKAQVRSTRLETMEVCTSGLRQVFEAAGPMPRALYYPPSGKTFPFRLILSDTPFKKAVKVLLWKVAFDKSLIRWTHKINYAEGGFSGLPLTYEASLYLVRRCAAITAKPKTFYIGVERA